MKRENLFKLAQNPEEWINSLPQVILISKGGTATPINVFNNLAKQGKKFIGDLPLMAKMKAGSPEVVTPSPETEAYGRLPAMMELMETMVEDANRLAMYESEVEMIHRLGMSFQEWRQLTPSSTVQGHGSNLIYITVS